MNTPQKNIVFRCDGNSTIGLGHVYRCIALAHMLRSNYTITFYCKTLPESLFTKIIDYGFSVQIIKEEAEFLNNLDQKKIVVIDNYLLDSSYQQKIKSKGCKLICIDDLHDKEFFADLIINPALGIAPTSYKVQSYTKLALGIEYALLRPAFLKAALAVRQIEKLETVFICFGGADPLNLTVKALQVVLDSKKYSKIFVVVGAEYKSMSEILSLIERPEVECFNNIDEDQMASIMMQSDLAIVPSSGILIETLACGVVPITCFYATNQSDFHKSITEFCGLTTLGLVESDFDIQLKKKLGLNLEVLQPRKNIQNILSGSSKRIQNLIKSIS